VLHGPRSDIGSADESSRIELIDLDAIGGTWGDAVVEAPPDNRRPARTVLVVLAVVALATAVSVGTSLDSGDSEGASTEVIPTLPLVRSAPTTTTAPEPRGDPYFLGTPPSGFILERASDVSVSGVRSTEVLASTGGLGDEHWVFIRQVEQVHAVVNGYPLMVGEQRAIAARADRSAATRLYFRATSGELIELIAGDWDDDRLAALAATVTIVDGRLQADIPADHRRTASWRGQSTGMSIGTDVGEVFYVSPLTGSRIRLAVAVPPDNSALQLWRDTMLTEATTFKIVDRSEVQTMQLGTSVLDGRVSVVQWLSNGWLLTATSDSPTALFDFARSVIQIDGQSWPPGGFGKTLNLARRSISVAPVVGDNAAMWSVQLDAQLNPIVVIDNAEGQVGEVAVSDVGAEDRPVAAVSSLANSDVTYLVAFTPGESPGTLRVFPTNRPAVDVPLVLVPGIGYAAVAAITEPVSFDAAVLSASGEVVRLWSTR
jgi:hypothetical protein